MRRTVAVTQREAQPHLRQDSQRSKDATGRPDPMGVMAAPESHRVLIPATTLVALHVIAVHTELARTPLPCQHWARPCHQNVGQGPLLNDPSLFPCFPLCACHQHRGQQDDWQPVTARLSMSQHTVVARLGMQNRIESLSPDSQIRSPLVICCTSSKSADTSAQLLLPVKPPSFPSSSPAMTPSAPRGGRQGKPLRCSPLLLNHTTPKHLDGTGRQASIANQVMGMGKTTDAAKRGRSP